jgi:hypothetical protein
MRKTDPISSDIGAVAQLGQSPAFKVPQPPRAAGWDRAGDARSNRVRSMENDVMTRTAPIGTYRERVTFIKSTT